MINSPADESRNNQHGRDDGSFASRRRVLLCVVIWFLAGAGSRDPTLALKADDSSLLIGSHIAKKAILCSSQIGTWDWLHPVPPHPAPLPWGEGERSTASRSQPSRNLPNNYWLNTHQKPAVPSP